MRATFVRGESAAPRGHALLFFREARDPDAVRACYVVVAPIEMDLAKYVPPMLAPMLGSQLGELMTGGPTAIPLPPIPEPVESFDWLERLAEARADDLLDGGSVDPANPQSMMLAATDIAAEYAALWTSYAERLSRAPARPLESSPAALPDVDELLLDVMTNAEKVGRLAKLAGTLRYAVDVQDQALLRDTLEQMQRIGRHLPERYRLADLLAAGQRPGPGGARLLELYMERCYKLAAEVYEAIEPLEQEISRLSDGQSE